MFPKWCAHTHENDASLFYVVVALFHFLSRRNSTDYLLCRIHACHRCVLLLIIRFHLFTYLFLTILELIAPREQLNAALYKVTGLSYVVIH